MLELLVLGVIVLVVIGAVGFVGFVLSLAFGLILLPFKLLGLIFRGVGALLLLPFLLVGGLLLMVLLGVGAILFALPFLPVVIILLGLALIFRRRRPIARSAR